MKRKIGISYTRTLFENYWNWFTDADLRDDVELVELSFEHNNRERIAECSGFILTGGVDIQPDFYGGHLMYDHAPESFQEERDHFETLIYRFAQLHKLPVLGICRGMQLVHVLEGGKLVQDLGEKNDRHRKTVSDKEHHVRTVEGTLLHDITRKEAGAVNSAHHQAIDISAIGPNIKVNAWDAEDPGVVEGIEFADRSLKGFMLCVQWHPERMTNKEESAFSQRIKARFLSEVRSVDTLLQPVYDPSCDELVTAIRKDDKDTLQHKYGVCKTGRSSWSATPLAERVKVLQRFSGLLEEHREVLALVLTREAGKPLQQSRNEINGARARIEWLTGNASRYLSDEIMSEGNGMQEKIVYEPLGTICNISAWNYPWLVGVNVFVPALLAGNAVVYKPSEYALLTGLQIEKMLKAAGVPEPVFQVAIGGPEVGELLLDIAFDGYYFTGSYATGRYIYQKVAPKMVPCQCELGGKDPLYVADDITDVKSVAAATADGAFYNNGQSCCAVERIYVHEKVYDQYISEFVKEVKSWKVGDPRLPGVYIGPLTRKAQLETVEKQVTDAAYKGAVVKTGGRRIQGKGYFFEPTVLTNVDHSMLVMKEESFGPVIGIMKVKDDAEAINYMSDTEYGLTASVYSSSEERAASILKAIDAGTGYWNCCDRVSAALPWSGRRHSGFGATLSHVGLRAFTQPKAYHLRKP